MAPSGRGAAVGVGPALSLSQSRGTYEVEFDHYDQVPPNVEQKVIEDIKRAREEEKV